VLVAPGRASAKTMTKAIAYTACCSA